MAVGFAVWLPTVATSVPPLTTMLPLKALATSFKVTRPAETASPPLPVMAAVLKFVPCVSVPLLLKARVPLSVIVLAALRKPPLLSCSVPAEMVVGPL